jgi:predicted Rossmann fold flavoprotein
LKQKKQIVVIGGGAAGFFGAIRAASRLPDAQVIILEKSSKLLSKVRISGGGRCNVTHHCFEPGPLAAHYPRGQKLLKQLFRTFGADDTVRWFEERGVRLLTEADGRMFPHTNSSETIIACFLEEARRLGIQIHTGRGIQALQPEEGGQIRLVWEGGSMLADRVLLTTGGAPKAEAYQWLEKLGHPIEKPVPSLFTFNIPDKDLHQLAGISVPRASVRIETSKLAYEGPLLITHWGLSGPAVLKLSAFGARWIQEQSYRFGVQVRWITLAEEEALRSQLQHYAQANPRQRIRKYPLFELPSRLWLFLCQKAGIGEEERWLDISKKTSNRLLEVLYRDRYEVVGKTTFKEEFVTCGGVSLSAIDPQTMESRQVPGLFFAGEVLDIDGITGGFNFQAAWTTAWIAGSHL